MTSHIYVIQCEHFFKIGMTSNKAESRIKSMKTGNPFALSVILDVTFKCEERGWNMERELHEFYSNKRIRGEWFTLNPTDILDIKRKCIEDPTFSKIEQGDVRAVVENLNKKDLDNYWDNKYMKELAKFTKRDIKWNYTMLDIDKEKEWLREWSAKVKKSEDKVKEERRKLNKKKALFGNIVKSFDLGSKIDEYISTLPEKVENLTKALENLKIL